MKKRLISGLLALMMMVTLLPSGLFGVSAAAEPNLTPDCVVYDASGNEYTGADKATIDLNDGKHEGWVRISKTAVRSADDPNEYTITLSAAQRFGTTVSTLTQLNGISNPDKIYAGNTIRVPENGSSGGGTQYYTIQPGDTLSGIAVKFGTTVSALARLNGISDPDKIYAGNRIRIR